MYGMRCTLINWKTHKSDTSGQSSGSHRMNEAYLLDEVAYSRSALGAATLLLRSNPKIKEFLRIWKICFTPHPPHPPS